MQPSTQHRQAYYRAAHLGLRATQTERYFSEDADARWSLFKGDLLDPHRLDLMLRDAAVSYPLAFAPREIFALEGLMADDPFGPDWGTPNPDLMHELKQKAKRCEEQASAASIGDVLRACCGVWGHTPTSAGLSVPNIQPAWRVVVVGPAAIIELATYFAGKTGFDFADQVVLMTDVPLERQIYGVACALLATTTSPRAVPPNISADTFRSDISHRLDAVIAEPNHRHTAAAHALCGTF